MTSTTDVVNSALRLVGGSRISNLTEGTPHADVANDIYDDLLDDLLRSHFWNFATKRFKLAQFVTTPAFGFDHAYATPVDWIRTVSCHADADARTPIFFREELIDNMRAIVTSADDVYMRYIARITDPNLWAGDFRRAVVIALTRDLAVPVASSNKLKDEYTKEFRRVLARAKSADAMGSSPEVRPRGSWVTRRGVQRPNVGTVD